MRAELASEVQEGLAVPCRGGAGEGECVPQVGDRWVQAGGSKWGGRRVPQSVTSDGDIRVSGCKQGGGRCTGSGGGGGMAPEGGGVAPEGGGQGD